MTPAAPVDSARVVELLPSVLIALDLEGRVTSWNRKAAEVFGVAAAQVLGRRLSESGIAWSFTQAEARLGRFLTQQARTDELSFHDASGRGRLLALSVTRVPCEAGGDTFVLFGAEVTERRLQEDQLRQSQKLEAIGQLAAGIAHEINTPTQYVGDNLRFLLESWTGIERLLGACRELARAPGASETALAELGAAVEAIDLEFVTQEIPSAIRQSLEGVQRVAKIVRAMKEFSHPAVAEKSPTDLNHAIETTVTVARSEWKYVAEVETDLDPDLPHVPCLPDEFNQVVLILLVNAAHAIAASLQQGQGPSKGTIRIRTRKEGDWAEIRVSDTGTGIPEAIRSRVWEPFFTTKEVGKGTGQGLALAHSFVVQKHEGRIWFETETGKGTTFIVRLPLFAASAPSQAA